MTPESENSPDKNVEHIEIKTCDTISLPMVIPACSSVVSFYIFIKYTVFLEDFSPVPFLLYPTLQKSYAFQCSITLGRCMDIPYG